MPKEVIQSLHSPQVERVKALSNSRAKKIRSQTGEFLIDSWPALESALTPKLSRSPKLKVIYGTANGLEKLREFNVDPEIDIYEVTENVLKEMSEVITPQGIIGIAIKAEPKFESFESSQKILYLWQMQDPGNAGTVIRSADAAGFDLIIFSPESVDIYSAKVIRSAAGSHWHIPVLSEVPLEKSVDYFHQRGHAIFALDAKGDVNVKELAAHQPLLLLFGNEARGIPELPEYVKTAFIPMRGNAESFNVATSAAIAMYEIGLRPL